MDFEFSSDTLMLRDMVRRFVQKEARPLEMAYFTSGALTGEQQARLRAAVEQMGLWGLLVPERCGGGGLDLLSASVVEMELGATFIPVDIGTLPAAIYACAGDQVDRFLTPALNGETHVHIAAREAGGATPEAWLTSATPAAEGYRLSGVKLLSREPAAKDVVITVAKTPQGLTAFLVEGAQLTVHRNGKREVSAELKDLLLGSEQVLGRPGGALELGREEAARAWILAGAQYVGVTDRLLEMGAEHARDWVSLGAPLAVRPALRRMLAEVRSEVEASRWLVFHAAWTGDQGRLTKPDAAVVRLRTGDMLKNAIDRVTIAFGGPGPVSQIEPRRMVHAVAPPEILDFALEQAREVIAADLLAAQGGAT
jgi:acyl-CoA dehydrogenase